MTGAITASGPNAVSMIKPMMATWVIIAMVTKSGISTVHKAFVRMLHTHCMGLKRAMDQDLGPVGVVTGDILSIRSSRMEVLISC